MSNDNVRGVCSVKVCESCPVKSPKDHLLLSVGTEIYKVCPNPDALLPYLIKDNPQLPVVHDHKIKININTAGQTLLFLDKHDLSCIIIIFCALTLH